MVAAAHQKRMPGRQTETATKPQPPSSRTHQLASDNLQPTSKCIEQNAVHSKQCLPARSSEAVAQHHGAGAGVVVWVVDQLHGLPLHRAVRQSVCLPVCYSVSLAVCMSVCLSVCLFVCLCMDVCCLPVSTGQCRSRVGGAVTWGRSRTGGRSLHTDRPTNHSREGG